MRFAGQQAATGSSTRTAVPDALFLAAVLVLSSVPYLGGLGLYSDDWTFLSVLHNAPASFLARVEALLPIEMRTRPVQAVWLAALYSLFGLEPLGYHVANTLVLVAAVLLFYGSLRLLGVTRVMAVAAPLVFGLLPHYSTDRFWIAAFQANAAVFLYFLSLYGDLRFVSGTRRRRWLWKLLGTLTLVASVLAYEVTAALFLINVVVLLSVARVRQHGPRTEWLPGALAVASNVLALVLVISYKLTTTVRTDMSGGYGYRIARIVKEAVPVHFGEYGLALPLKALRALRDYPDAMVVAASVFVGMLVFSYLYLVLRPAGVGFVRSSSWRALTLAGVVLFAAGYAVSLTTYEIGFHTTGTNNRTAIGAAIGVGCVFAGALGWLSRTMPSDRPRWILFAASTALLAASGTLLTNTVALFWVSAARQQQTVIASIRQQFPELAAHSTVLLDGLCPFEGPAVVFATNWDVTGMLRLVYADESLQGDVLKPNSELTPEGVRTILFDDVIHVYPYGRELSVHNLRTATEHSLDSLAAARDYFETIGTHSRPDCPPYTDGDGVDVF